MTVYDYCHIGHGRMFVVFDVITRYLRSRGFDVNYVRNITDIDDKIINRANENGESVTELVERFIDIMHEDEKALNVLPPDAEPRATEHMDDIIEMIEALIENGYAYIAENGDVYYDIVKFANYGELAHQDMEQLQAGARVDVLDVKLNPLDFVLWKLAKPDEPKWDSPWGEGRPGWHIECSAMSTKMLGKTFDIHGGGVDLVFPHHQNEIAQSEGAFGCRFVNTWIHGGHVQVNREKMSKSLGNFFTIGEVLEQYEAEVMRYFMIASNYRSPINYSQDNLNSAKNALDRFYKTLRGLPDVMEEEPEETIYEERFNAAMDDDFNTPIALAELFELTREINRLRDCDETQEAAKLAKVLVRLAGVLGIAQQDPQTYFQQIDGEVDEAQIEELIAARDQAREDRDFDEADRLRNRLLEIGIVLEDGPKGTSWRHEV